MLAYRVGALGHRGGDSCTSGQATGRYPGTRVALEDHLELFLIMRLPVDVSMELGSDLLCTDALPRVWTLMPTQGDLGQLLRHSPKRPLGLDTVAAARHYVTDLLRACPSSPSND